MVAISLEAIPLGYLTWTLAGGVFGRSGGARLGSVLLGAVGSTAAALLLVTTYVLAYQHVSARRRLERIHPGARRSPRPPKRLTHSWPCDHGMVLSQVAAGAEAMLPQRYSSPSDRLVLFAASLVEFLGFHQLVAVERFLATFHTGAKRREWGVMPRAGIPSA